MVPACRSREDDPVAVPRDIGDADLDARCGRGERRDHRAERNAPLEGADARRPAERPDHDFGFAVAVQIARCDAEPIGVVGAEGEE